MKKQKNQQGITLIALVITIIILLILAGISISALTDSGLFKNAKEAKQKSEAAQNLENETLKDYESKVNEYLSGTGNGSFGKDDTEKPKELPIEKVKNQLLSTTENTIVKDSYDNQIVVPAGFKIKVDETTNNATTVNKGIVIVDSNENQFVWIPVGTIYTNTEKTESKTIELNRYTFSGIGVATEKNDSTISEVGNYQELATSTYGNTTAKDIEEFKTSVVKNGGYYIGRYEARTEIERTSKGDELTTITEKGTDYVYNYVTQIQAAELARNMYNNSNFTSDLMNSYAWDTATLFLQTCGTNSEYSKKKSVNTTLATRGTNNTDEKDMQCNVYDMASNVMEWTTESCISSNDPCATRGGTYYDNSSRYTSIRLYSSTSHCRSYISFRSLLYL